MMKEVIDKIGSKYMYCTLKYVQKIKLYKKLVISNNKEKLLNNRSQRKKTHEHNTDNNRDLNHIEFNDNEREIKCETEGVANVEIKENFNEDYLNSEEYRLQTNVKTQRDHVINDSSEKSNSNSYRSHPQSTVYDRKITFDKTELNFEMGENSYEEQIGIIKKEIINAYYEKTKVKREFKNIFQ